MPDDAGMDPDAIRHPSGTVRQTPDELVPLAEGARRLGLAHDTARKHLSAGVLRGEKRQGRWWVWVPMPDASGPDPAPSGTMPDARLIETLQSENAYLRQQLDHQTHIIAGLVQRLPELPATTAPSEMPQDHDTATLRDVQPAKPSYPALLTDCGA
jgi:hypothetical protein